MEIEAKTIEYQLGEYTDVFQEFVPLRYPLLLQPTSRIPGKHAEAEQMRERLRQDGSLTATAQLTLLAWGHDILTDIYRSIREDVEELGYDVGEQVMMSASQPKQGPYQFNVYFETGSPEELRYVLEESKLRWQEPRNNAPPEGEPLSLGGELRWGHYVTTLCFPMVLGGGTKLPNPIWGFISSSQLDTFALAKAEVCRRALNDSMMEHLE